MFLFVLSLGFYVCDVSILSDLLMKFQDQVYGYRVILVQLLTSVLFSMEEKRQFNATGGM